MGSWDKPLFESSDAERKKFLEEAYGYTQEEEEEKKRLIDMLAQLIQDRKAAKQQMMNRTI
jgi:hypothetical protein